jgi:hypothetical protein
VQFATTSNQLLGTCYCWFLFLFHCRFERHRERERERVVKKPINKFTFELRPAKLPTIAASSIVFASTDQPSCSGKEHSWGRRACVDGKQNDDVFFFEGGGGGGGGGLTLFFILTRTF